MKNQERVLRDKIEGTDLFFINCSYYSMSNKENISKADSSYVGEENALEGRMFTTCIALHPYYEIYNLPKERHLFPDTHPRIYCFTLQG